MKTVVAVTPLGEVRGRDLDGCELYAGIRYAEPPVGVRRFRPPVPVGRWAGTFDATEFGASAPQPPPLPGAVGVKQDLVIDEDCLFLNVYTPAASDGARRPVMVWIHGGAYTLGSGDLYDAEPMVRRGDVVVVTINYRLGALGFMPLDHLDESYAGSGNNGLRDQICALQWVRDNIAAFGGDPDNVTIFGESAGGGCVFALLAAPAADGLFHKAIAQSGAPGFAEPCQPADLTASMLSALDRPDGGVGAFLEASVEELLAAQVSQGLFEKMGLHEHYTLDGAGMGFHPVVDGVVLTRTVAEALAEKGADGVPLIAGTNLEEGTLFRLVLPPEHTHEQVAAGLCRSTSDAARVIEWYRKAASGRPLLVDLFTETAFRLPTLRAVDALVANGGQAWVYLFTWPTPALELGATHALEIPFVFDVLDSDQWKLLLGPEPPRALAHAMQDAWLAFARSGKPVADDGVPWPAYDPATRPTMEFGTEVRVVDDPVGEARSLWYETAPEELSAPM